MKTLKKISLHDLSQAEMTKREENMLKGGGDLPQVCVTTCGCKYAGDKEGDDDSFYGGSSKAVNGDWNMGTVRKM